MLSHLEVREWQSAEPSPTTQNQYLPVDPPAARLSNPQRYRSRNHMRHPAPATRIRRTPRQHLHQRHFALTRHLHQPRLPNRRPHRRRQLHHHQRRLPNQRCHFLIMLVPIIVLVPLLMLIMLMIVAIPLIMTVNTARRPHNPTALTQPTPTQSLHRHAPHRRHRKQHQ